MKKLTVAACLMALPLLTGCNADDVPTIVPPSSSSTTPNDPTPSPTTTPSTATTTGIKKWGDTYTWSDKVSVTVEHPTDFTPSNYSTKRSEFKNFTTLTITIKNNTNELLDSGKFRFSATAGDKESQPIYDYENGLRGGPDASILPGKSLSFKLGYGYEKGQDFNLIITGYDKNYDKRGDAIFSDKIS